MDVAEVLRERWDLKPLELEVLTGGMNSAAWLASTDEWRVVVKAVGPVDTAFEPGLELAARLDDAGIRTGRPRPSKHGRVVERVDGRQVAVLEYVDGVELSPADQAAIGDLLGRVHSAAALEAGELADWLQFLLPFEDCLDLEPWIRPAVEGAVADAVALGSVSWAWLHGDPAAEAFLRQADDSVALIDWGSAMRGPLLYDVASAVMYNGAPVVPAYLRRRPELADELERGLPTFLRVRYAVQAGYFAWRITNNILTGISTPAENLKGLTDARRSFGL
ncbi:homoserine kinase type II [Kribbella sp. VKM Ac-2569]|uniref:phosphotransferase enzyme family protein n=1 Tax=Kribbella sp. VKM Ac-2569 TaxID=2512220 RepID=UPI00102C68BD|nr:phosphotransferase [Kribbella sp. VKM Ac-2569]RZT20101.1 homoserine kinase type II [Kribbella sp. VKM Ac-2569]